MERRLVYPGDPIGAAEEFTSGPGTYEENGEVYAATIGHLVLDTNNFEARVEPFVQGPAVVRPGDVVIGTVEMTRSSMAIVEVRAITAQPKRAVGGDTNGTLHVSKASERYVENMEDAFRVRDIVRARVLETNPAIQLTTKGPDLGVLKSYCPRCGTVMERRGKAADGGGRGQDAARRGPVVVCPECDWKDTKKMAEDYGLGNVVI